MTFLVGVYGASGFGREVMPYVRLGLADGAKAVFIDDANDAEYVNGITCLRWEEFVGAPASRKAVCIAVANSVLREDLATKCQAEGFESTSVIADTAVIMDQVTIGEGAILASFVTLTSNICIGRHFHANLYSYVAHDCIIGDFVTFAPAVRCNGNIVIEDHAYIGTGAVLKQGRPGAPLVIGRGAVVGMGAVVTKNVPPGVTVVGNPARPLTKTRA